MFELIILMSATLSPSSTVMETHMKKYVDNK